MRRGLQRRPASFTTAHLSVMLAHRTVCFTGHAGITLAGDAWGDASAAPVLLLPGGGQTRHSWRGTGRAIAHAGWQALALDARGHGDSAWAADGDYTIDAFAADLRAVVAALGRPPIVVGASLGGITALLAEGEAPGTAAAVVLVDVAARIEIAGAERVRAFMSAFPEGFASLEDAADAVAAYLPHRPRPRQLAGLTKSLRRRPDGRWRWHWDPRFLAGARPPAEIANPPRLAAAAAALTVPTLLVRGRKSDVLSEEGAAHFLGLVPHARYVDVSGAGHMVAGDRNDRFTDAVLEFLSDLRALPA
ncbi:MAG: alpha/beta hydrolase [Polyangiaceae bacterium UTPRO1]|nr:MAG: alpha/beta hydrolase [Polyangiaceae bacterium UTPRO1]